MATFRDEKNVETDEMENGNSPCWLMLLAAKIQQNTTKHNCTDNTQNTQHNTQPLRVTNLRLLMADRKSAYRNLSGHLWHCGFCFTTPPHPTSLFSILLMSVCSALNSRLLLYITDILCYLRRDGHLLLLSVVWWWWPYYLYYYQQQ